MRRSAVAAVAVCLGAVVMTGCGEESGSEAGTDTPSGSGSPSTSEDYAAAARKEHDRAWPDIGKKCRDVPPEPAAGASESAGDGDGAQPENPKYAENHAFKKTTDVSADQRCRGEEHAAAIAAALKAAAPADLKDERRTLRVLEDLGYAEDGLSAQQAGPGTVGWDVFVPGAGPCISGSTDPSAEIEVHGVYMEGGCTEPVGGH